MFDGEGNRVGVAAQVEIAVTPGMELGRAAQRLTSPGPAAFPGMMHDEYGDAVPALQFAQEGQ